MDGILGAIISSFLFLFFAPADCRFENDQIQINKKITGFLGACCNYEVIEKKHFLFEKKLAEFKFEEDLYFKKKDVTIEDSCVQIHLVLKDYDYTENHYIAKDTILRIPLKK
ncbi:hypothetical protein [Flavobacterium sp. HBTb2-11-1]|uniref:hypothetical protein n=1 Tax=Flavobacterium sp. HBTb2-11-1 TaxID=2692212 RepID=UPI001370DAB9|nr:hypothetical protein [Flavobacterium sp. HBTb2-11-1]MXO06493.1 hypothetical protein [Flavobacterium sp. HBTb2-11-1]